MERVLHVAVGEVIEARERAYVAVFVVDVDPQGRWDLLEDVRGVFSIGEVIVAMEMLREKWKPHRVDGP